MLRDEGASLRGDVVLYLSRNEVAVEDCLLLEEIGWLFNGGLPEMPPDWERPS